MKRVRRYEDDDIDDVDEYDSEGEDFEIQFADPGGDSALRAASDDNPRDRECPTCKRANRLTREDAALGYQCDGCAERDEGGGW